MYTGKLCVNCQSVCMCQIFASLLEVRREVDVIYQTRVAVFHRDIQTPRRELKIRPAAEYF